MDNCTGVWILVETTLDVVGVTESCDTIGNIVGWDFSLSEQEWGREDKTWD